MKIIKKWEDKKYNVQNYLYKDSNGLLILHTLNKQTLDTYASFLLKAGAYFEKELNVPNGTSHFLEHLITKPNKDLKTRKEIDSFEFGNKNRAQIHTNAGTGFKYMSIYGFCNANREEDLMKRLKGMIDYPIENFNKEIEIERKIILAELQREYKPEKNSDLQFMNFALKGKVFNDDFSIIGLNEENIKKITVEDVTKAYNSLFKIDNAILTIQSPNELSSNTLKYLSEISKRLRNNGHFEAVIHPEILENTNDFGYFYNAEAQGIRTFFFSFKKINKGARDYKLDLLQNFTKELIKYVAFNELREKKGYIYGIKSVTDSFYSWDYRIRGFEIVTDFNNLEKSIKGLKEIIETKAIKFLKSKQGVKWFENWISSFIFPHTPGYNEDYSENLGVSILSEEEILDFEKAKEAAMKITVKDVEEYYIEQYIDKPTFTWVDTSEEIEKVKEVVQQL